MTCVVANTALSILSPSSASNTLKQYSASVGFNNEERQFSSRCILAFIVPQEVESICGAKSCADLHRVTFTRLRGLVHPSCLPDDLVFVKFFPVTKHGMYLFYVLHNYHRLGKYLCSFCVLITCTCVYWKVYAR